MIGKNSFWMVIFSMLFVFLCYSQSIAQQISSSKYNIAILDFEGQGISDRETKILTDRFRGEIVNTDSFIVVERKKMQDILSEQGFQLSGCTSTECALEIGQILNTQKMITGSVGKIGKIYTVNVSMIDVETSRIDKTYSKDYQGNIEGLMQVLKIIALEIADIEIEGPNSKVPLYISGVSFLASVGFGAYSFFQAQDYYDKYEESRYYDEMVKYKNDAQKYDKYVLYNAISAGISSSFFLIYYRFYKRSIELPNFSVNIYQSDHHTIGIAINKRF